MNNGATNIMPVPQYLNGRQVIGAIPIGLNDWQLLMVDDRFGSTTYSVLHASWNGNVYVSVNGRYDIPTRDKAISIMLERAGVA